MQKVLSHKQLTSFYTYVGDESQVDDLISMMPEVDSASCVVTDIGGGVGFFAWMLDQRVRAKVRVYDLDQTAVTYCLGKGIEAHVCDALNASKYGDESVVCFNLMLHHLVADSESGSTQLQLKALSHWNDCNVKIFVNEFCYESYFGDFSGWLIFKVTSNRFLSAVAGVVGRIVPSLSANTLGVGVRFRSRRSWEALFEKAGLKVVKVKQGKSGYISLARKLLMIRDITQDSFLLARTSETLN